VQDPHDINEKYDFGKLVERRHDYKIIFESDPSNPPEEFADVERDIDPKITRPIAFSKKTHTQPKDNLKMAKVLKQNYRKLAKYKKHTV